MHDGAVIHRAVGHRVGMIGGAHHPSRVNKLREMYPLAGLTPVAVLSSKVHIKQALAARDVWSQNVSMRMPFFSTTL